MTQTSSIFIEIFNFQRFFGQYIGISVDGNYSLKHKLFLINSSFWFFLHFSIVSYQVYDERSHGRQYLFGDITYVCGLIICGSMMMIGWTLNSKNEKLADLYEWCNDLVLKDSDFKDIFEEKFNPMHTKLFKMVKIMHGSQIIATIWLSSTALLSKWFLQQGQFTTNWYSLDGWVQEFPWYYLILFENTLSAFSVDINFAFSATTYFFFSMHICAQFEFIEGLFQAKGEKCLKEIIEFHGDLIDQIGNFASIFSLPMFLVKICTITSFVMLGLILLEPIGFSLSVAFVVWFTVFFIYSYFGQKIMDETEDLADVFYQSNWIEWSVKDQMILLSMLQLAQKSKGIKVGGIDLVCLDGFTKVNLIFLQKNLKIKEHF